MIFFIYCVSECMLNAFKEFFSWYRIWFFFRLLLFDMVYSELFSDLFNLYFYFNNFLYVISISYLNLSSTTEYLLLNNLFSFYFYMVFILSNMLYFLYMS